MGDALLGHGALRHLDHAEIDQRQQRDQQGELHRRRAAAVGPEAMRPGAIGSGHVHPAAPADQFSLRNATVAVSNRWLLLRLGNPGSRVGAINVQG